SLMCHRSETFFAGPFVVSKTGREGHAPNKQERQDRRPSVLIPPDRPPPPHLYSDQAILGWERDPNSQQHRRARDPLPSWHPERPVHWDDGHLPHAGSVPAI